MMTSRSYALPIASALALLFAGTASAVNWTPTAGGTYSWNDNANWDATFPDAAGAVANLSLDITGNQAINLNANQTVGSLTIGDTDSSNTLTINAGSSLIFDNGGSNTSLVKTAGTHATPDLISAPVILNDNLIISVDSAYNSNSVAGGLRIAGGISDGGSGLGITKTGSGTLSLQGGAANSYTGPTIVNNGTLVVQTANSIPDSSPISVIATGAGQQAVLRFGLSNAGVADTIGSLALGGTTTSSQPIVNVSYNQTLTLGGNVTYDATNNPLGALMGVHTGGSPWSSGTISLGGATRTFNIGDSSTAVNDLTILHRIQNGSIIKEGPGQLAFTMANNLNTLSNIWVKEGNVYASQPNGLSSSMTIGDSSGSNNILVHGDRGGATSFVIAGGNTGTATISGHFGIGGGTTFWGGTIQLGDVNGPHDLTIRSTNAPVFRGDISGTGDLTMNGNGFTLTWDQTTTSINHAGTIDTGTTGNVNVYAAIGPNVTGVNVKGGTLTLRGVNTYTTDTTVNAGILTLFDNAGLLFEIGASGVNNSILGVGTANLNGDFYFDLTSAGMSLGDTWTIVNVATLNETFGSTFTVNGFTDIGGDQWEFVTGPTTYTFSEATGLLTVTAAASVVPEPQSILLAGCGLLGLVGLTVLRRWRN